ncbi:hypothetical protein ACIQC9_00885 [Brevundimonas sp. NPDC092305]|uniref:hypothetical protein n=1 Tax=Brevundimonas sp. NPDC092305 TaxID=3363957 RepID=UPI0037F1DA5E
MSAPENPAPPIVHHAPKKSRTVKLNASVRVSLRTSMSGIIKKTETGDEELLHLTDRWILAFCETPVLLDAELMRRVLADAERRSERDR